MRRLLSMFVALAAAASCSAPSDDTVLEPRDAGAAGLDEWTDVDGQLSDDLGRKLDQAVVDLGLVGAAMGVAYHGTRKVWSGASGLSDVAAGEAWAAERSVRIGSVTKTFTAALVYLLIEDGVVTLDDPLERWVSGYYDGAGVTVRHLLSNTSGIVSYNYVGDFDDTRRWTPTELVDWAVVHEPGLRFAPGTAWEYSNTNYVLLGLVIEAASAASYADVVERRLLRPLGLAHTYVATSGGDDPDIVRAYDQNGDLVTIDPSFGWAAGAIVSTPSDLARWGVALFGGDVLAPSSLETMITPVMLPGSDGYGHGAFVEVDGPDALYGHTGGIGGFLTYMYFWRSDEVTVVAVSNALGVDLRTLSAYGWSVVLGFDFP